MHGAREVGSMISGPIDHVRVNDSVRGRRGITGDTALRLARHFGTDAQSWLNLQAAYDLRTAELAAGDRITRDVLPRDAR